MELDSRTLLKMLIPAKVSAILMLICGIYIYGYDIIVHFGITQYYVDGFLSILNERFGIFNNRLYYHLAMIFLLSISFLPTDVDPSKYLSTKVIMTYILLGLILLLFPFTNTYLYIIFTPIGFVLLIIGLLYTRVGMSISANKDEFNNIQESFSQFETKLENPYSVNLPTYYFLKNKKNKLEKRFGWINIVNPFRACLVMGTPGSGKTYCFINPAIEQMLRKRFAMFLYDFKFPTLSVFAYNHFIWAKEKCVEEVSSLDTNNQKIPKDLQSFANAQFYVLNFDSPAFSNKANPLNAKIIKSDTDAKDAAETIMLALCPESREKRGDFFVGSAINLVQALIQWLKQYKNGKYCTFAHMVEFLNVELDELFPMLMSVRSLEGLVKAFADAYKEGAIDQLQGQVASAKIPLVPIAGENMWWICSQEDFELDINDPLEPKLLCIGNNPEKKDTYSPVLALYASQGIKQMNKQGKHHSSLVLDELPTIFLNGINNLIATARSNKVAVYLGIQDNSQLETGYGKTRATEVVNTIGNFFSGQVQGDTAKFVSNLFGKNLQRSESHSISADGTISKTINQTRDLIIPENKVSNLTQGFFVGRVADDFEQPIDKKLFHSKIDIDTAKLKSNESKFIDIPIITHFEKATAPKIYVTEFLDEFTFKFEKNKEMLYIIEEILRLSNTECVYELYIDDFYLKVTDFSYETVEIIKVKLNIHNEFDQLFFDTKIKVRLIDYYIKQLCDYDFIQRMGQYNGNKDRYYVTLWMKAHVRARYYEIKDEIKMIVSDVVEELLRSPQTQCLFRPEYIERRMKQQENEAEKDDDNEIEINDDELSDPNEYY